MAAVADWADYASRIRTPRECGVAMKVASTVVAGRPYDAWMMAPLPPAAAPTTAVAPTNATVPGAMGQADAGSEQLYALSACLAANQPGTYILCDRLSHQGGLSGTTTGAQTTNLPTAALTRYTDGVGVMLGLTIYSQVGTTAGVTVTASYTDDANNAGQTTAAVTFGTTGYREANRLVLLPLAQGDKGVRAVASVSLSGTTGTAGNFGVTLFKPLMSFIVERPGGQVDYSLLDGGMSGGLPEIVDGACLFWVFVGNTTSQGLAGVVNLSAV